MKTGIGEAFLEATQSDAHIGYNADEIMWFQALLSLTPPQNFSTGTDQQQTLQQKLFHTVENIRFLNLWILLILTI